MRRTVSNRSYSLFIAFFILTLTFSLISAGIFNANTTVGMAAYAKKSKKPSEENSNDGGGGSSGKSGDSSGGSDSKDKKNNDQGTNDNDKQHQVEPPKTGEGEEKGNEPTVPPVDTTTPPPPPSPPPTTCEKDPSPECTKENEQSGPLDCSTNPDDAACKSITGPIDCKANPDDAACKPTDLTPSSIDCTANPDDASCKTTPVTATASKDGYESAFGSASFEVIHATGGGGQNQGAGPAAVEQIKYLRIHRHASK